MPNWINSLASGVYHGINSLFGGGGGSSAPSTPTQPPTTSSGSSAPFPSLPRLTTPPGSPITLTSGNPMNIIQPVGGQSTAPVAHGVSGGYFAPPPPSTTTMPPIPPEFPTMSSPAVRQSVAQPSPVATSTPNTGAGVSYSYTAPTGLLSGANGAFGVAATNSASGNYGMLTNPTPQTSNVQYGSNYGVSGWQGFPYPLPSASPTVSVDEETARKKNAGAQTQVVPPPKPLNVQQLPPGEFDLNTINSYVQKIQSTLSNPASLSADDFASMQQGLANATQQLVQYKQSLRGPAPTIDSPSIRDFLNQLPTTEQTSAKQYIDGLKNQLGLPQIESNVLQLMDSLSSTNEVYNKMITEIRDNPNLPKALANRRITTLVEQQKAQVTQMQAQLEQLGQLRDNAYKQMEMGLNIFNAEQSARDRQLQNNRQLLQIMAENGGLANLDETQAQYWSQMTGIPVDSMMSLIDEATRGGQIKEAGGVIYSMRRDESGNWVATPLTSAGSSGSGLYDDLGTGAASAILREQNDFYASDIVKRYTAIQDANATIGGISPASQNPADHQAIVYSFAKALDPDSAVKEGEYETIKKYAQSMISRYGREITNAINGTGFLSAKAITDIQSTIKQLEKSKLPLYQQKLNETARTMDNVAGKPVSSRFLPVGQTSPTLNTQAAPSPSAVWDEVVGGDTQPTSSGGFWGSITDFFSSLSGN